MLLFFDIFLGFAIDRSKKYIKVIKNYMKMRFTEGRVRTQGWTNWNLMEANLFLSLLNGSCYCFLYFLIFFPGFAIDRSKKYIKVIKNYMKMRFTEGRVRTQGWTNWNLMEANLFLPLLKGSCYCFLLARVKGSCYCCYYLANIFQVLQ